jgi:ankyrin repeat protein
VAHRLLERGADVNARGDWAAMTGLTALRHAVSVSRLDMVRLLVEAGADLEARDEVENSTPADWASFFENTDIHRFLEEAAGGNR